MSKPRLVFFQWNHESSPFFLQLHMQLHVKCLAEFFDVILINEDCDYQQICDYYQPELTLFESGYRTILSKKLVIKNTNSHPSIPKLGFHNGDPWCDCRTGFISDMEHWGIETFFTISTTTAEHTPELSENLFVWSNFIDSDVHRDYNQIKVIPILFSGFVNQLYPWRQKIHKAVSGYFPSLTFPHLGYESNSPLMIHSEQYARTINASWFVPACGTVANELVRKHLEIPGSGACLITEKTPSLEAAGFVDMTNCVFADENNVLDKLHYLFENKDELKQIISNGYKLVQSCHTFKQRDQIFQWFNLNKVKKPNDKIIQVCPFQPLRLVDKSAGIQNKHINGNGYNLTLLRKGDEKLWAGKYREAEALYIECLNYIFYLSEPKLKLAICYLCMGKAREALHWITEPNLNNFQNYRAVDPDPVEWAYLIISLLCKGDLNDAIIRVNQFPQLNHPELNRTRVIINYLQDGENVIDTLCSQSQRRTVHALPDRTFVDWKNNISMMLLACNQPGYAKELDTMVVIGERSFEKQKGTFKPVKLLRKNVVAFRLKWLKALSFAFEGLRIPNRNAGLPPISELDYVIRLIRAAKIDNLKRLISKQQIALKDYFKAFQFTVNGEEFTTAVLDIILKEDLKKIILIGSPEATTKIYLILTKTAIGHPDKIMIQINPESLLYPKEKCELRPMYQESENNSLVNFPSELDDSNKKVNYERELSASMMILSDDAEINGKLEGLEDTDFIAINHINTVTNFKIKQKLALDHRYALVSYNSPNEFAIFKNLSRTFFRVKAVYVD